MAEVAIALVVLAVIGVALAVAIRRPIAVLALILLIPACSRMEEAPSPPPPPPPPPAASPPTAEPSSAAEPPPPAEPGPTAEPPPTAATSSPPPHETRHGDTAPNPKGPTKASAGSAYPQFPWPPPPPSAEIVVPNPVLLQGLAHPALGDIAGVLVQALQQAGYYQNAYYQVPRGFALVARLERIHPDGSPYQGITRFDSSFSPLPEFSVFGYLRALFGAPTGYYRVIAFVISDAPFAATGTPVSSQEANMWLEHGANALPLSIADVGYSAGYACTALIYEFQKQDAQSNPVEDTPSVLPADTHLVKARIAEALKWQLH